MHHYQAATVDGPHAARSRSVQDITVIRLIAAGQGIYGGSHVNAVRGIPLVHIRVTRRLQVHDVRGAGAHRHPQ